jgi:dolichol-phosphate mannosyltransferase
LTETEPPRGPLGPVVVIIPTYNERENLDPIVARVRGSVPEADMLVVDDNSPDGTGELADKLAAGDQQIFVLHRPGKGGLGAAYVAGFGTVRNWPKSRELLSRGANTYARLMLRVPVHDTTAGYRAYRAETLRAIALDTVRSQGYCFQIDLTLRAINAGLTVIEVPITFTDRTRGASKMSRAVMAEAFWRVAQWGMVGRLRRRRPRGR